MYSACKFNKQGDNIQPWHTPFPIWNQSTYLEALYSQQKQDQEFTVAQIMNSLFQNSTQIEESRKNHKTIQVWPKSNPLQLYSSGDK